MFHSDILNLLSMADMWKTRAPPIPLSFEGIKNGSFILRGKSANETMSNGTAAPVNSQNGHGASTNASGTGLKDQKTLTLQDNLELFISRYGLKTMDTIPMADSVLVQTALPPVCKQAKKQFHLTRTTMTRWTS